MKHFISTLFLIVCGIFCSQFVFSDTIPAKGKWCDDDVRSVLPPPPTASIEGKVLSINFTYPLSGVTVKVTDNETGKVVYEGCISASTPQSYPIVLSAEEGEYTLSMTCRFGYLTGEFTIQ